MSTVPYIFADQYGNIALSELDANFANVKANVDYATQAAQAVTSSRAAYVTANAQANITSLGTLTSLTVSGTVTSNATSANTITANASTLGNCTVTNNLSVGNLDASSIITNIISSDDSTIVVVQDGLEVDGNLIVNSDTIVNDLTINGATSASGNVSTGNLTVSNTLTRGLEIINANWVTVPGNATTETLSSTTSTNVYFANTPGWTLTINMPTTAVEGQITAFSVTGNAMTLVKGTGNVNENFAGVATVGTGWKYMYRPSVDLWVRTY